MGRVLGHRQTKGADNGQTDSTVTASHLYSTGRVNSLIRTAAVRPASWSMTGRCSIPAAGVASSEGPVRPSFPHRQWDRLQSVAAIQMTAIRNQRTAGTGRSLPPRSARTGMQTSFRIAQCEIDHSFWLLNLSATDSDLTVRLLFRRPPLSFTALACSEKPTSEAGFTVAGDFPCDAGDYAG